MTKELLTEIIYKAFPYSEQITDLDFSSAPDAIYFTWRGNRFRTAFNFRTDSVNESILSGDNLATLANALIKRTYLENYEDFDKR